jgi:hypothetical protein
MATAWSPAWLRGARGAGLGPGVSKSLSCGPFKRLIGLGQQRVDRTVNRTRLQVELFSAGRARFRVQQHAAAARGLVFSCEAAKARANAVKLRSWNDHADQQRISCSTVAGLELWSQLVMDGAGIRYHQGLPRFASAAVLTIISTRPPSFRVRTAVWLFRFHIASRMSRQTPINKVTSSDHREG